MSRFLERLERDRDFYKLKNRMTEKELDKIKMENDYLKKRNKVLEIVEMYLPQRIATYKKKNGTEFIIQELQLLSDALEYEKNKLREKEDEQIQED
jgi:hypothetical protein